MLGLARLIATLVTLAVILLQHPSECWAAETTERGVSGTLYGGAGTLVVPNNESGPDEYQVTRFGIGVLGVLRPNTKSTRAPTVLPCAILFTRANPYTLSMAAA